jgi:pyruvate,water dikinase
VLKKLAQAPDPILPLAEVGILSSSQIGLTAKELSKLQQAGVPVPPSWVVPITFLEGLVEGYGLSAELAKNFKTINWQDWSAVTTLSQRWQNKIKKLHYPPELAKALLTAYTTWWEHHSFRVIASPLIATDHLKVPSENHLQGEANLGEALLQVWAAHFTPEHLAQLHLRWQNNPGQRLLPGLALVIQLQPVAIASGWGYSCHPHTNDKRQLVIESQWGEHPPQWDVTKADSFTIDARTLTPTHRHIYRKATQWKWHSHLQESSVPKHQSDQPSLTSAQLSELAQLLQKMKQQLPYHIKVRWILSDGHLFITDFEPLLESTLTHAHPQRSATLKKDALTQTSIKLKGISLTSGHVTAPVRVISQTHHLTAVKAGEIIVVGEITREVLHLLPKVAGIVCETGVSSIAILQLLKRYQVPTLVTVANAGRLLTGHRFVTIDTRAGTVAVTFANPANQPIHQKTPSNTHHHLKILISAGNPLRADEYRELPLDGIGLLRSEFTIAQLGTHPLALIRDGQARRLTTALTATLNAYRSLSHNFPLMYRACHLTSTEYRHLNQGERYEGIETNPLLGFRGGLRILHQPELFELETKVLSQFQQQHAQP